MIRTVVMVAVIAFPGAWVSKPAPVRTDEVVTDESPGCFDDSGNVVFRDQSIDNCQQTTQDAGKACHSESDCEGVCLALLDGTGGQCSRTNPVFGCTPNLLAGGEVVTICVD
ncbi:hypothetical protein [Aliiroseovarius sp. YM-037]|uniref:hypothetical protein n=1 Tax=Aliiroseovarius sp. YM-037 TaxID=3341728 RepID=UPI003A80C563